MKNPFMHPNFQDSTRQAYQIDPNLTFWKVKKKKKRKKKKRIAYPLKIDISLKMYHVRKYKFTLQMREMDQNPLRLKKIPTRNTSHSRAYNISSFTLQLKQPEELLTTNYSICLLKFQTDFSERGSSYNYSLIPPI